jgi:hypothetical protein
MMSLLEILKRAGGAAAILVDGLARIREIAPDAAEEIDKILAALNEAIGPDNLIALAESLPKELANIAQGKLDPRKQPSNLA